MPRGKGTNTRTDLLTPRLPAGLTVPDQAYGQRTSQQQSMKIVPPGPPPAPAAAPSVPGPAPAGAPGNAAPPLAAPPAPLPGELPWLHPTTHGLPVTTGLPNSPGAGPEALTGLAAQLHAQQSSEQGTLQQMLGSLAARPGASSAVKSLAANAGAQV